MAQLVIRQNATSKIVCGGSIISTYTIMTAAHCTFGYALSQITVRVGTKYLYLGGELLSLAKIINHPGYNPISYNNDLSLLILSKPITLVPRMKEVVVLPGKDEMVTDGTILFVSGWGLTLNVNETRGKLRGVEVPAVNFNKCKESYLDLIQENMCAGYFDLGGKDACLGSTFILEFS